MIDPSDLTGSATKINGQNNGEMKVEVSDGEIYTQSIMDQWDEHMEDFEPSDLLTVQIGSRQDQIFKENVVNTPTRVRGAWFIAHGDKKVIDFWIVEPSGTMTHQTKMKNEGIFFFDVTVPGVY